MVGRDSVDDFSRSEYARGIADVGTCFWDNICQRFAGTA
jgi:hypothetical protein